MPDELLTASQVGALAQVSERTVRRWVKEGTIPTIRRGRLVRFDWAKVRAWLESTHEEAHGTAQA